MNIDRLKYVLARIVGIKNVIDLKHVKHITINNLIDLL